MTLMGWINIIREKMNRIVSNEIGEISIVFLIWSFFGIYKLCQKTNRHMSMGPFIPYGVVFFIMDMRYIY